jgi:LuxR family maltose regulon positive regulatory protein
MPERTHKPLGRERPEGNEPLLVPKLQPPRLPADLVHRARLLARLDAGLHCALTVISAPAGFGKSTLVASWLASLAERQKAKGKRQNERSDALSLLPFTFSLLPFQAAWLSLDSGDNDPARFWRYVVAACQVFGDGFAQGALARLDAAGRAPFPPPSLEPAIAAFLNDLAGLPRRAVLVIEDYHLITEPQVHATLAFVVEHLPATAHLVLITRSQPPLPLAPLRARARLHEVGAADLRFSQDEARAFLARALPPAPLADAIARLEARTEGWAAGLRLAALALQGHADPHATERAIDSFAGSQPQIVAYLAADVLDAQPAPIQRFLLETSILGRMCAPLCDAIMQNETGQMQNEPSSDTSHFACCMLHSQQILQELERQNLFLIPLDDARGWYRYHALFAEAMRHEARRRLGDEALRACYGRASAWYERQGMLPDAVDAALAAGAWPRAADLLERIVAARPAKNPSEPHTLRRWLEQLPEVLLSERPALCFSYGFVLLRTSGRRSPELLERLERWGRLAEQGWRREGNTPRLGEVFAARALGALWSGRIDVAIGWARQALACLPEDEVAWRGICLGFVGHAELRDGLLDAARRTLLDARARCEASGDGYALRPAILMLGEICAGQSELQQAEALYRLALENALGDSDLSDQGNARLGLARLAYERNDLDAAEREALVALAFGARIGQDMLRVRAARVLAWVSHARGAAERATQQIAALLAQMQPQRAPLLYREILAHQAQLHLAVGDLAAARRWSATRAHYAAELPATQHEHEALLDARLLIAQGQAEEALRQLEHLRAEARACGRIRSELEIQVLAALAHAAREDVEAAGAALRTALALAHACGYQRLFLDEGDALAAPLRTILPTLRQPRLRAYAQALAQTLAAERLGPELPDPLSPQEQRVLGLLAAGNTNPEIARELVVSINTVKTQLKQIYRKLGVGSRHEARAAARRLGLL